MALESNLITKMDKVMFINLDNIIKDKGMDMFLVDNLVILLKVYTIVAN